MALRVLLSMAVLFMACAFMAPATAKADDDGVVSHEVSPDENPAEYWTEERMRNAKPMEKTIQSRPGDNVVCQQDARICPDGSSVARVAPYCEFAPCMGVPGGVSGSEPEPGYESGYEGTVQGSEGSD